MASKSTQFRVSEGDWICEDSNCGNVNFARRQQCNLCGKERPCSDQKNSSGDKKRKLGHEIGKAAAEKSKGLFSADDWQCGRCGNVNWARRTQCNMCNAPKFNENEERTGLGGGYNERENVEYVEREESDSEYDDFGRKKRKKYTSESSTSDAKEPNKSELNSNNDDDEEEEDEEDDDDEGISKYKLEEGNEDDEDEDEEDDEDISKYKLDSSDDEENEKSGKG